MKRILAFLLLLALAVPAWGASGTWTNATEDDDWTTAGNWDGGVPGAPNDEAIFDGSEEGRGLPSVNLPDLNALLVDLIFAADYSTVEAGSLSSTGLLTAEVVARDGNVILDQTALWGQASNGTLTLKAGVEFDNTFTLFAGGIITPAGAGVVIDGGVSTGENGGTLDWGNGNLTVIGYMKANECIITHINTTGAALTCDTADNPNLDLGTTTANTIAVTTSAAVTIGNHFACGTFTMGANVAGASKTITVGAGGFEMTAGTLTGELDVDLSAAAGAYTQTAGTIAAAAVLNVTTGSGGFAWTALTKTGTLNGTVTASMTGSWNTSTSPFDLLTVNAPATLTADAYLYARALAGTGLVAGATFSIMPTSDNFWTLSGTGSSADLVLRPTTAVSNAALIDIGAGEFLRNNPFTPTLNGGLTCGDIAMFAATGSTTICNGPLTASGTVTLGWTTSYGILTLGPNQVHRIGSTIARSGTSVANAITFGGRVYLGGSYDGTGITPTWGGALFATDNLTFDGKEVAGANASPGMDIFANAKTVTVQGVNNSTAATPIRVWNNATAGAANTNCVFHPGAPSGASMMGMGN